MAIINGKTVSVYYDGKRLPKQKQCAITYNEHENFVTVEILFDNEDRVFINETIIYGLKNGLSYPDKKYRPLKIIQGDDTYFDGDAKVRKIYIPFPLDNIVSVYIEFEFDYFVSLRK